jgi:ribonuclease P protein component
LAVPHHNALGNQDDRNIDSIAFCFLNIHNFRDFCHEAHLSTKQPCARTSAWLPPPYGNRRRPRDPERAPWTWPQKAVRLNNGTALEASKMPPYKVITKRADFLSANRGKRYATPVFVLLVHGRKDDDPAIRLGITITKKVGNAVIRNRMRRRFRELMREMLAQKGKGGADHILIGRAGGIEQDFALLRADLQKALGKIAA